jgi:hypothetical protein
MIHSILQVTVFEILRRSLNGSSIKMRFFYASTLKSEPKHKKHKK